MMSAKRRLIFKNKHHKQEIKVSQKITAVRGFKDILEQEAPGWRKIEDVARTKFLRFGFKEIRLPLVEKNEVFTRGIGEHTDIVEKEMYTFLDRNDELLSLRPEATAGVIRAVVEHDLYKQHPVLKLFTFGPMFRRERPQKGRLRQFHQFDAEVIGSASPVADAEIICLAWQIIREFVSQDRLNLELNSLGCRLCRPIHRENLLKYLEKIKETLCDDCRRRAETNPLRVLDCKNEHCKAALKDAPLLKDYLCEDCVQHFSQVRDHLNQFNIPYILNPHLVRGLDYYVKTTFELVATDLGAQATVAAGGRYDGLVRDMGGDDIPGVGMAIGAERLMMLMEEDAWEQAIDLYLIYMGEEAKRLALSLLPPLRETLSVYAPYEQKGLKAHMRMADKLKATAALIIGDNEIARKKAVLKHLVNHEQIEISFNDLAQEIKQQLCAKKETFNNTRG